MKQSILITNDDGIGSGFLHALATALSRHYSVTIAAPSRQQSWIGRAVSRDRHVAVEAHPELPWPAWTIDGTPTDCVNIAIANLLKEKPVAVVSGINIGYNTTTQLIYSSGTVAGAMEGAFWGLPAIAVSQEVPDAIFEEVVNNNGRMPDEWEPVLHQNAQHAADWVHALVSGKDSHPGTNGDAIVHNLNYPSRPMQPYQLTRTVPAPLEEMSFFEPDGNGGYNFRFSHGISRQTSAKTDREAIASGEVSHSILNFSGLGRDLNH